MCVIMYFMQLRELEVEYEAEQRRSREAVAANRKLERMLAELKAQADEDHRLRIELQDQVNALTIKLKTLRRQLEEAVSIKAISLQHNNNSETLSIYE